MQFWNELEGKTVDGYLLRRLVRSEGRSAWFETEIGDERDRPATISLREALTDAEEVVKRLQAAERLKHPNLLSIGKIGRTQLDQTLLVYAVMEHIDQNLSDLLRERPLSKEEARQVAEAMVAALTAVHQQGWVHGRVEPASVLAVGEMVKLRSDCLQSPGGSRAGDVAGVGATLFQAFTQRKTSSADDAQINRIPAPFAEIVRNSLSARWGLVQVATALNPVVAPITSSQTSPVQPARPAAPTVAERPIVPPVAVAPPPPSLRVEPDEGDGIPRRTALYVALAVALLVILCWFIFRPKAHAPASAAKMGGGVSRQAASPDVPAQAPLSAAKPPASPPRGAKPSAARIAGGTTTIKHATAPATQAGIAAAGARSIWRVVAYTYRHQDQAQNKADELNRAHPGIGASVLTPSKNPNHYLVVLGGAMDRRQAFEMRGKALGMGLPPDTYVQNFSE